MQLISNDGKVVVAQMTTEEWRALVALCRAYHDGDMDESNLRMGRLDENMGVMFDLSTPIKAVAHFITMHYEVNRLKGLVDFLDEYVKGPTLEKTKAALELETKRRKKQP